MKVRDESPKKAAAVWKKPSVRSGKAIQRLRAARSRQQRAEEEGRVRIKPVQARFLAELTVNGGNVSAAARAVGVSPSTGKNWMAKPHISAGYDQFLESVGHQVADWGGLLGRAQQTLVTLLDSDDDRVRKDVAMYLVDRNLGKVSQKIDATVTRRESLSEIELQAALSLVAEHGLTLADASRYVRENPDEVSAWASRQIEEAAHARRMAVEEAQVVEVKALVPGGGV